MQYDFEFRSRRSCVMSTRGMAATSHPLAAQTGAQVLREGGNAADAAIAAAAMLCVVEPVSNGIGGDCFALYFDAATKQVSALNGSGRSAYRADADALRAQGYADMPKFTGAAVTVPGVVRGWADMLAKHGSMPLGKLLAPAIEAAEQGFAVTEWIAEAWALSEKKLLRAPDWASGDKNNGPPQLSGHELLKAGRAPQAGEIMALPTMARTLRGIAEGGPDYIYKGEFARDAAAHVQAYGGWLEERDFAEHKGEWGKPLSVDYRGVRLYECPPNGQGLAAIVACSVADDLLLHQFAAPKRLAYAIDCMRLGLEDSQKFACDPDFFTSQQSGEIRRKLKERRGIDTPPPNPKRLLEMFLSVLTSRVYANGRRSDLLADQAFTGHVFGPKGSDTVYLSVVDAAGNACSWIQSCYMGVGTGLVVPGTGVSLQNRGHGFSLDPDHPNCLAPHKRPYHTIIPAMTTRDGELHACFGVMGGYMQPQGHFQVLTHLLDGMNPQQALDAPRWQLMGRDARLMIEDGFGEAAMQDLTRRGYKLEPARGFARIHMGGGQVIIKEGNVLIGGSDPRKDGCAVGL